jgi:hypothetical protein
MHLADADTSLDQQAEDSAAMSPAVGEKNRCIHQEVTQFGFECPHLVGNRQTLAIYDDCDLHVGYECHAHRCLLSHRLASLLSA